MNEIDTPVTAREPVIEISHVQTRFGSAVIHEDVNLTIYRGEILAIVGGSGSGKSTLLREIIMLHRPARGSIRVLGQEVVDANETDALELRRRWGVMFQYGALFSALTVAENVAVPLREHTDLSENLIQEIATLKIALARLPANAATKYPSELSGGMMKRAALARAIALDPEILFLDEPTAGLDPISAGALDELVEDLKELLGLTVVMVTHDLDSLWRVTDRVAVLGRGMVVGVGSMEELSHAEEPLIREYFSGPRGRAAQEHKWNQK
ncbi:MAG: ABC transporter ATP-binding protein [Candidatus Binatia bacterium]